MVGISASSRTEAMMRKMSGAFWAVLLALMGTVGFAQVSSKNANESGVPSAQATKDPKDMSRTELTTTVKRLDADLFGAYNDCELEKFGSFFPENLEFYHDQTDGTAAHAVVDSRNAASRAPTPPGGFVRAHPIAGWHSGNWKPPSGSNHRPAVR